jgi:hypothetical protein
VAGGANNADYSGNGYVTINPVPAPAIGSFAVVAPALFGFGLLRRRRRG